MKSGWWRCGAGWRVAWFIVATACACAACGNGGAGSPWSSNDATTGQDATPGHKVDTGVPRTDSGGVILHGGDTGVGTLEIQPHNPTLNATGPGATIKFKAILGGTTMTAAWSVDAAGLGTIDSSGLFTASGAVGGQVGIIATASGQTATTTLTVDLKLTENSGKVSKSNQGLLGAGAKPDGGADASFAWLYPYDRTVFPRDVPTPTMQFGGTGFDAAMVHVTFPGLDYTGFYGPATPGRIQFTSTAWTAITGSANGSDAVKVQVTKLSGSVVSGPITETWTIAQGSSQDRSSTTRTTRRSPTTRAPSSSCGPARPRRPSSSRRTRTGSATCATR